MKYCPKCGTKNADAAVVCKNASCGHRFPAERGEEVRPCADASRRRKTPAAAATPSSGNRYCRKCGTPNRADEEKCTRCGATLPQGDGVVRRPLPPETDTHRIDPASPSRIKDAKTAWMRFAVQCAAAAAAVAIVVGVIVAVAPGRNKRPSTAQPLPGMQYQLLSGILQPIKPLDKMMCFPPNYFQMSPEEQRMAAFASVMSICVPSDPATEGRQAEIDAKIQSIQSDQHTRNLAGIEGVTVDQYNAGLNSGITRWTGNDARGAKIGTDLDGNIFRVQQNGTIERYDPLSGNFHR